MTIMERPGEGGGGLADEWPAKATDQLENVVTLVRSKAVRPAQTVARAIVFGIIVATMGAIFLALAAIGTVRVLNVYAFPSRDWASLAVVGGIFTLAGLFLSLLKRSRRKSA